TVEEVWQTLATRVSDGPRMAKVKEASASATKLYHEDFSGLVDRIEEASKKLEYRQQRLRLHYYDGNRESMKLACEHLKELRQGKMGFFDGWQRKIRLNLRIGTHVTSITRSKGVGGRHIFATIMSKDGAMVSSIDGIGSTFVEFFEALLGSSFVPTNSINGEVIEEGPLLSPCGSRADRDFTGGMYG
ncbi:hypothetical protein Dimus_007403, partial [Dionaea muscipula]